MPARGDFGIQPSYEKRPVLNFGAGLLDNFFIQYIVLL